MNMRRARFDDNWRRTWRREYPVRLESVKFKQLLCIADGELTIPTGICAIVGGNGVGKSALLAAIAELLADPDLPLGVGHKARLRSSQLEGTAVDHTGRKNLTVHESAEGVRSFGELRFESEFYWLEPSYLVNLTHKQVNEDANFSELLEPLSPYNLNADELETIWYLLGKKVDSCLIYEVTEYGGLDPFPYFIAEAGGRRYGSESMGYGELSLLFVMWKLRTIERDSVLVLEEPEAHVSPRSQRALMDILARSCDEKGLSIILTTHSPTIIANLPQNRIVLISKGQSGQTSATVGPSKISVKELLGESALKRALILMEDRAAVQFGVSLLEQTSVDILSQVEILEAGSAAKIDSVLSNLPKSRQGSLKVIGVYDGDMRTRVNSRSFNWPHFFLPGAQSPEELLRNGLLSRDDGRDLLASELHRERTAIDTALDVVDGVDPHDWFTQLPASLHCEHAALMGALVRIWLRDNKAAADSFVESIINEVERTN
ncbi:bacteriophage protein [Burkholderia pseudomallei]|nr:bacteriophage protein [Burkholderia pseudomallei]